ncbi:M56 family metallopeptidase [Emticicia sp. W12TSBA100-4]|uniref:M56 family metallopeptidase n=1 Tax=Emticicia sp. W12TSBA100-4 TaxID=3160965 RepID=UPI00330648F3
MEYLLKSTICLTAFYGLYFFGFRRMSFHALNRFYLLVSLALSLTIPLLSYERTEVVMLEPQPIKDTTFPIESIQENTYSQVPIIQQSANVEESAKVNIDWMQVISTIYLIGVGFMLFLFIKNLLSIFYSIKSVSVASSETLPFSVASTSLSYQKQSKKLKILRTKSQSNSSFFNYVFLNSDNLNPHEKALIIAHEGFHAQRLHTLDLIILGILKAVFWFNPIVYFYQKSLKQIHEYEVDALMSATYDGREYAHLLLKLGVAPSAMITNQFSTKPLSERIQFLFKTPTKNMKKLLYFLSLPIIAVGVMAFAKEKVVRVYQEKNTGKPIFSEEIKVYPLEINDARNYASWTSGMSDFDFTPKNISLNRITAKNYNGFHYSVNPNSLTIKTIEDVNKYIAKRSLALIVTEKSTDTNGNLTKLGLAIKHLRTNQMTNAETFDMVDLREKGKNGAFIFIESYDKNFKESQMSINYGTKNLVITKSSVPHKNLHSFVAYNVNTEGVSAIKHSSDMISYCVFPGRITEQTLAEAQAYFAKNGFELKVNNSTKDAKGNFESITLSFGNESKTFIIKDLKHWIRLKSEKNSKFIRQDESIIFEADTKTLATKIFVENRMFKMTEKSGAWEIKDFAVNEKQLDSTKFSFNTNIKVPKNKVDSFNVIANQEYLVEGKDYIVKNSIIFLNPIYKNNNTKIAYHLFMKPLGSIIYPELTKLNKVEFPDMRFSSKTPVFLAKNENSSLFRYTPFQTRPSTPFSKVAKNQDTLRTILETNKLGKNPLVFINGEEYPSSVLYRINPDEVTSTTFYPPNNMSGIERFGEAARDGVYKITTKGEDFIIKNDKQHKIVIENVRMRLIESKKRVRRQIYQNSNGVKFEEISFQSSTIGGTYGYSVKLPRGKKVVFFLDDKLVSEEDINNSKQHFTVNISKDEKLKDKYSEELKNADVIFNLKTKQD